ncbi:MAG: peptide-methionine (S)-S-oxide reductase MsrA [Candidatus Omnitrophica bacterium]|nr:peptide-methionine (S)-S-oxide reductase MsrA [Candidatus Omnitrophota bacterium]
MDEKLQKATFAGGCFWGIEKVFGEVKGVVSTMVGYTGGTTKNPSYEDVSTGLTGHAEAIEVTYDSSKVSYSDLLEIFWIHHDPTTTNRQGPDIGTQYRSVIFYHTPEQEKTAKETKELLGKSGIFKKSIVTEIVPASEFYEAEEYHQKYLKKNPHGYCSIQLQSPKIRQVLRTIKQV